MLGMKTNDWGEESSKINKPLAVTAIASAVFLFCSVCHAITSHVTSSDARLAFIKQDYPEAMSYISKIEDSDDSEQILAALDVKCQILLDKNSGFYDPQNGYNILKRVFMANKNINDAFTLLQLTYELHKPFSDQEKYLEFLSSAGVGSYTSDLIGLYLSSNDSYIRGKAYRLLQREPESVSRNIAMARILIDDRGGKQDVLRGIDLLIEAGSMGSPDAEAELAMAYIKLISVSDKSKGGDAIDSNFIVAINKAIAMGYRGHLLDSIMVIVRDGTNGVSQNLVLASELQNIRQGEIRTNA